MNAWHDFFLAQAAAAGVLTGLVFVGVSINLQKIVSDPNSGLVGRAAEALILLVTVLTVSVFVLVPGQGPGLLGAEVLGVGDHEGRPARLLRVAGGVGPGRHADAGDRGRRRALGGAGRALLAGGEHGLLDPGGFGRRLGIARRDQPLGAGRGFLPPYSAECVE
jgi:hypothetical protein